MILVCDVLLVEDDLDLTELMASYLRRGGLNVSTAHSSSSALHLLTKITPRVAVLDYRLPGSTGAELAHQLRQALPELPIIMMSGAIGELDQETLEKVGVKVFVNKPVPLRALLSACTGLLKSAPEAA
jgi:DNA-binding response OmpR family regulator